MREAVYKKSNEKENVFTRWNKTGSGSKLTPKVLISATFFHSATSGIIKRNTKNHSIRFSYSFWSKKSYMCSFSRKISCAQKILRTKEKKINNDHPSLGIDKLESHWTENDYSEFQGLPITSKPIWNSLLLHMTTYHPLKNSSLITFCITHKISETQFNLSLHIPIKRS